MDERVRVYVGYDPAETQACVVAAASMRVHLPQLQVERLSLLQLQAMGLYTRKLTTNASGHYWDAISQAPMSTQHAIARFLVPQLCEYRGWALFTDGDVLARRSLQDLWALRDDQYAVQVVQHAPQLDEGRKKAGAPQEAYTRKNWSSVMLFNCGHPANQALTPELVNTVPGRDLHRFCWLADAQIGALPPAWNYLVGVSPLQFDPALVHWTLGGPWLMGYAHSQFADEWRLVAKHCGYHLSV